MSANEVNTISWPIRCQQRRSTPWADQSDSWEVGQATSTSQSEHGGWFVDMTPGCHCCNYCSGTLSFLSSHCNWFEDQLCNPRFHLLVPDLQMSCSDLAKMSGYQFCSSKNGPQGAMPYFGNDIDILVTSGFNLKEYFSSLRNIHCKEHLKFSCMWTAYVFITKGYRMYLSMWMRNSMQGLTFPFFTCPTGKIWHFSRNYL